MKKGRLLLKAITYRLMASGCTVLVVRVVTGSWKVAGMVFTLESVVKFAAYGAHEWAWEGRK